MEHSFFPSSGVLIWRGCAAGLWERDGVQELQQVVPIVLRGAKAVDGGIEVAHLLSYAIAGEVGIEGTENREALRG